MECTELGDWSLNPRASIVVVAYNEGDAIVKPLTMLLESVNTPSEVVVVVDAPDDSTIPVVAKIAEDHALVGKHSLRVEINSFGRGPAKAIKHGFKVAVAPVVVVTMADGCDDPRQIDDLIHLVERGVVIAAASRYMRGGQQIGAPLIKSLLSRAAGSSLHLFARVGTWDATNSFKGYSREFVEQVGIESERGFEVAIELVAKARRRGLPIAEVPTIWLERVEGVSNFKLIDWLPRYLYWYFYAFGLNVGRYR